MARRQQPDATAKNQKIHLQPGPEAKAPPRTGPILGAVVILDASTSVVLQPRQGAHSPERKSRDKGAPFSWCGDVCNDPIRHGKRPCHHCYPERLSKELLFACLLTRDLRTLQHA